VRARQVRLKAGQGVCYPNLLFHWGSDYSPKLRRCIHIGHRAYGGPINCLGSPGVEAPLADLLSLWRFCMGVQARRPLQGAQRPLSAVFRRPRAVPYVTALYGTVAERQASSRFLSPRAQALPAVGERGIKHRFQSKRAQRYIRSQLFPSTFRLKSALDDRLAARGPGDARAAGGALRAGVRNHRRCARPAALLPSGGAQLRSLRWKTPIIFCTWVDGTEHASRIAACFRAALAYDAPSFAAALARLHPSPVRHRVRPRCRFGHGGAESPRVSGGWSGCAVAPSDSVAEP
jgi:hypothetical protein